MDIVLRRKSPLGLREQVKRQVQLLIENGTLAPGRQLPSARDLAMLLRINRNTVTQAYKELDAKGLVKVVVGSGTYVRRDLPAIPKKDLVRLVDGAVEKARQMGFHTEEIVETFINRLSGIASDLVLKRVLVVDCNHEVINYICLRLKEEVGVSANGVLIQELENDPSASEVHLAGKDLVVCGFNHLEEFRRAVPRCPQEVVAVMLQVDAGVIHRLGQLPAEAQVGFVCANQRSTETLYNSTYFSSGKKLHRTLAGLDNEQGLEDIVTRCDVIFVTGLIFDRLRPMVRAGQELIRVDIFLDPSNIRLIKERLYQKGTGNQEVENG